MRKDQVITYHKVRVKPTLADRHVAAEHRGKIGVVQPSREIALVYRQEVGVKFEDEPNTTYYFKPEWLDDVSSPPAEVGDIILVRAKVTERADDLIRFRVEGEAPRGWLPESLVYSVVERAPWYPVEPLIGTVVRGINLRENTPMGTWVRQTRAAPYGKNWFNLVHGGDPVSWNDVVDRVREAGASFQYYQPTISVDLGAPRPPE